MRRCSRIRNGRKCRNEAAMEFTVEGARVRLCVDHFHLESNESFMKETAKRINKHKKP